MDNLINNCDFFKKVVELVKADLYDLNCCKDNLFNESILDSKIIYLGASEEASKLLSKRFESSSCIVDNCSDNYILECNLTIIDKTPVVSCTTTILITELY